MRDIMQSNSDAEWMVVYVTNSLPDAHIVAGRLQTEGIAAMVHVEPGASAIGISTGTFGEKRVLVKPTDYELAIHILEPDEFDQLEDSNDKYKYHIDDEHEDE